MAINYIEGPFISDDIDRHVGIHGNVIARRQLTGGMSGSGVFLVTPENQPSLVIKSNPDRMHRSLREIRAYELVKGSPIEPYLTMPNHVFPDKGVIILPFFDGIQLRQGLQSGIISPDIAMNVLSEVIDVKKRWWSSQEKKPVGDYLSMQKEEWPETLDLIGETISKVATRFDIPTTSITDTPFEINGISHAPLKETIEETGDFLQKDPPYEIVSHGDAAGGNLLVNTATKKWRLTDLEWAWWSDPAQSYSRLAKQESTTTATHAQVVSLTFDGRRVAFTLNYGYHPVTQEMQRIGNENIQPMQEALNDPDFSRRYAEYMRGSHLREVALAPRRGDENMAILGLHNTSRIALI